MSNSSLRKEPGLLSDIEILERLVATDDSCIFMSPLIDPTTQLGSNSIDVRLGTELIATQRMDRTHIDLTKGTVEIEEATRSYYRKRKIRPKEKYVLHPGEFALASTLEYIRLPKDIAARIEGRSTYGRLGLQVHATAGFVDPGFEGTLTFELINSGTIPVTLSPGLRVGQLCFFRCEDVQVPYMKKPNSKYGGSLRVRAAQASKEVELVSNAKTNDKEQ